MNRAHPRQGAPGTPGNGIRPLFSPRHGGRGCSGFTLLEMCIVLFIIALLFGVTMPAMQSAFTEQHVRHDSHQLALMVKTAMIQSAEQHRAYVIDLTPTAMALHPQGQAARDADASSADDATADPAPSAMEDVDVTSTFDAPNKLLVPDPVKANAWVDMPPTSWIFQPGALCPATHVRLARGDAWVEMNFNALTGNVQNEGSSFP